MEGDAARLYADLMRASVSPELAKRSMAAAAEDDVTDLLPFIKASTLLLQRRDLILRDIAFAQRLAANLSDSRLVVLDGAASVPFLGKPDEVLATIDDFLEEPQGTTGSGAPVSPGPSHLHRLSKTRPSPGR
jgi:pimeloyl-ACP methyl ester carboxylesterase